MSMLALESSEDAQQMGYCIRRGKSGQQTWSGKYSDQRKLFKCMKRSGIYAINEETAATAKCVAFQQIFSLETSSYIWRFC
jgi:hypothetical protein